MSRKKAVGANPALITEVQPLLPETAKAASDLVRRMCPTDADLVLEALGLSAHSA